MTSPLLTVIITLRAGTTYDMVSRLRYRSLDPHIPDTIRFLVVDEGSEEPFATEIRNLCAELGYDHIRHESGKPRFCASSARNAGAMAARSKYIMHEDIDLFAYPGFYRDMLEEIEIQDLESNFDKFITVPCLYLNEEATELCLSGKAPKNAIINSLLTGDGLVSTYLPASSAILLNRMYYLSIGGYNDLFSGWGLEDLEYAYRLTRSARCFMTPAKHQFLIEGSFAANTVYKGWRSQFRLHGDLLARKGIVIFHAHHPKDTTWRNKDSHEQNRKVFATEIDKFDRLGHTLPALPAPEYGRSLIFGKGTFAYNRALMPLWGVLLVKGYEAFSEQDVVEFCRTHDIQRVIFTNPYASEMRLRVYRQIKEAGIPFVVVERGALNESMFIDDTGFSCESTRYGRAHWPPVLDDGRRSRILSYIETQTSSSLALERQGKKLGGRAAATALGIPETQKVLFVPFQSRSDTTVTYFAGAIGSYDNFVSLVREVTTRLPSDWTVIYKNHPLSAVSEDVPGAKDVGDMHINDALEITDYVLLMNSGVGVLSLMFNKPVISTAQAFYTDPSLNRSAATADDVLSILDRGFVIDPEDRLRFLSYLTEDFYSFGKFTVREKSHTNKARLTITERIDYYRVNLLGTRILDLPKARAVIRQDAPIYDVFRNWILAKNYVDCENKLSSPVRNLGWRIIFYPSALVAIRFLGRRSDYQNFKSNPRKFIASVKKPFYKRLGMIFFGKQASEY